MEKYEFRFHNKKRMYKFIFLTFATFISTMAITIIIEEIGVLSNILEAVLFFLMGIASISFAFIAMFFSNAPGFGILHENHVEINLNGKEYLINYTDLKKIHDKVKILPGLSQYWVFEYGENSTLKIHQGEGFKSKNLYPLEKFILALKKRVSPRVYIS
ncbi:MAG: hypothetical protein FWB80_09965 [Defluviitaleaceae bacterium]|nr:hypothetical protein [Defluviitaleaceae bacterium]